MGCGIPKLIFNLISEYRLNAPQGQERIFLRDVYEIFSVCVAFRGGLTVKISTFALWVPELWGFTSGVHFPQIFSARYRSYPTSDVNTFSR